LVLRSTVATRTAVLPTRQAQTAPPRRPFNKNGASLPV
jgi:hypothetical protein